MSVLCRLCNATQCPEKQNKLNEQLGALARADTFNKFHCPVRLQGGKTQKMRGAQCRCVGVSVTTTTTTCGGPYATGLCVCVWMRDCALRRESRDWWIYMRTVQQSLKDYRGPKDCGCCCCCWCKHRDDDARKARFAVGSHSARALIGSKLSLSLRSRSLSACMPKYNRGTCCMPRWRRAEKGSTLDGELSGGWYFW